MLGELFEADSDEEKAPPFITTERANHKASTLCARHGAGHRQQQQAWT